NPDAVRYMVENIGLNRVENRVLAIQGDAKDVISKNLKGVAHRVLMPLPEKAYEYLDYALLALHPDGGWIHYYAFEHAKKPENPIDKTKKRVVEKLERLNVNFDIPAHRIVRTTGPNWYQTVVDIRVHSKR
ncbi:MAG: class I SAM-dependent methyltransferase family protein, partial [Candidatus Bathyarchaeia archaeon]